MGAQRSQDVVSEEDKGNVTIMNNFFPPPTPEQPWRLIYLKTLEYYVIEILSMNGNDLKNCPRNRVLGSIHFR